MPPSRIPAWLLLFMLAVYAPPLWAKTVVGWVERAKVFYNAHTLELHAKIDSGAKTSSLNADNLVRFEKDGKPWVRFEVVDAQGEHVVVERPLLRTAKVRRHFGDTQVRPVIELGLCLGDIYEVTQFTLVDRTGFNYPLLVGRRYLDGHFLIDPGRTHLSKPACTPGK
ncbi:MAG: RimK/LysX family protein [Gammaproteobacteria bacterium]